MKIEELNTYTVYIHPEFGPVMLSPFVADGELRVSDKYSTYVRLVRVSLDYDRDCVCWSFPEDLTLATKIEIS